MENRIRHRLEELDMRVRQRWCLRAWALWFGLIGAVSAVVWLRGVELTARWNLVFGMLGAAVVGACALRWWAFRRRRELRADVQAVERLHPDLETSLLAAVDLHPDASGRFSYLQQRLVNEVLAHARSNAWTDVVSPGSVRLSRGLSFAAAALFAAALFGLMKASPVEAERAAPVADSMLDRQVVEDEVRVEPGDVELEKGRSLLVSAEFDAAHVPGAVELRIERDGEEAQLLSMTRSLDDPLFGRRLAEVDGDLRYTVTWNDRRSQTYSVTVFEYPNLVRSDVACRYPEYAQLEDRVIEDTRRVTVPEGTEVTLICMLNKAVASAELFDPKDADAPRLPLLAEAEAPRRYTAELKLEESRRLRLALVDEVGRENRSRIEFVFQVKKNKAPRIQLTSVQDLRVSPLEEVTVGAGMSDDFGLRRVGLSYRLGGDELVDVVLGEDEAGGKPSVEHTIAFEELDARPDQLLSYFFWAEDRKPDGELRRVSSDLYFAEVRPFEEIFREAEAQPGGQQQQQQQRDPQQDQEGQQPGQQEMPSVQLSQSQKDVVLATWKLARTEADGATAEELAEDLEVVTQAQRDARDQLELLSSLPETMTIEGLDEIVEASGEAMDQAIEQLEKALSGDSSALHDALGHEQQALQELLRLRAMEFEVMRSQQQQQQQQQSQQGQQQRQAGTPSQQQLQQLELRDQENRYETRSQAQQRPNLEEGEEGAAREQTQQNANRLKELARRQEDLNERVRELQSELEALDDEAEREELERRLKRLQEEQEQILRDADELAQDLEQSPDAEPQTQQSMEDSRENVRRASEALQEGRLSEALNEGSRAREQLEELEDELREQLGEQFDERMRELRDESRRIEDQERRLAEDLSELNGEDGGRSLREDGDREALREAFERQDLDLDELLQQMEDTVREAELDEPLLAEELYEAVEGAREGRIDEALEDTAEMLRQGFLQDAEESERAAREGLEELREGVERASDRVLGGEAETLERAADELERLQDELEGEIARARGERREGRGEGEPGEPREGEPREGEPREGQGREGEPREGEPREGQRGEGEPREGEPREGQSGEGEPREGQRGEGEPREGQRGQGEPPEGERRPGEGPPREGEPGEGRPGEGTPPEGERRPGEGPPREGEPGEEQRPGRGGDGQPQDSEPRPRGERPSLREQEREGGDLRNGGGGGWEEVNPLTGDDYLDWADRLRDVEDMLDDSELGAEAARVRSRAREIRRDTKRHSEDPNWDIVEENVLDPLAELRQRVVEELRRARGDDESVPLDRDPVPPRYADDVRRYYERLGKGK